MRTARLLCARLLAASAVASAVLVGPAPAAAQPAPPSTTAPSPHTTLPSTDLEPPPGVDLGPSAPEGPTPTAPDGGLDGGDREGGPGFFDLGGRIRVAINDWFRDLVISALNPILELLGRTVLATPDVTGPGRVRDLWAIAAGIANGVFVLFVLVGGTVVMAHETLQTRYSAKEIAPRLVVGMIAANASLALAGHAIGFANALARAFLGEGVDPAAATDSMAALVLGPLEAGGIFLVLLGGVAAVLGVVLAVIYIIRVALTVLLVAAAPLALATHALPQTEGLARLWWRAFVAVLAIQVGQALVLISALRIFFAADGRATLGLSAGGSLVDLLVVVCLLWVLVRIPTWASKAVFGSRGSSTVQAAKNIVVYRAIRAGVA